MSKEPYDQIYHQHCWEVRKPPCGQRIVHYECCLCKRLNPMIAAALGEQSKEIADRIEHLTTYDVKFSGHADADGGEIDFLRKSEVIGLIKKDR